MENGGPGLSGWGFLDKITNMIIFPAVDIRGGKCVRLMQGRADQETVYGDDPAAMGRRWQDEGASWLHVVDLDGAFGARPQNLEVIRRLRQAVTIPVQLGGGLRSLDTLATYIDLGIDRLILGTAILKNPDLVAQALETYPGRIALGLDAKDGLLAVEGWTETTSQTAAEVAKKLEPFKPAAIIYTDISRDGVKRGVNLEATGALAQATDIPVIASGGVSSLDDIKALLPLESLGVMGVITGVRNVRGEMNIQPSAALDVIVQSPDEDVRAVIEGQGAMITDLARLNSFTVTAPGERPKSAATAVLEKAAVFVSLEGILDIEKEVARLEKEMVKIDKELTGISKKLNNEDFLAKAPEDVVEKVREKHRGLMEKRQKLDVNMEKIKVLDVQ